MAEDALMGGPKGRRSHSINETPFEAFYDGSWHGVDHIRVRDGGLFVKFIFSGSMVEHNVDGDHLRMRSRRPTCFDCSHLLKPGVDVCVQLSRPLQGSPTGEIKPSMLLCHDARLITIKRNHIEDQCHCLFFIMLYKNQCPDNTESGEVISDRREEVVTLHYIFLLQKLQPKELHEGSVQWSCAVDCLSRNRSKLLSARFSQEIAHLIVLSILKGMEFSIELVEGKIIYRIIKGGKVRCNLDSMSTHPRSDNNMEIVSFQRRDEALCPIIKNIPVTHAKKRKLTEDKRFTMKTELDGQSEYMRFTGKTELDGLLDVFSYEQMDLRRSKRRKTQAERFTSYDTPNFGRDRYKRRGASSTKHDDSHRGLRGDSPVEVESTYEEAPVNITRKQTSARTFMVKENPSSSEGQHKSTTRITHVKEKPSSMEVKEESTVEERSSDSHIPRKPAKSKEKNCRPPLSLQGKLFTSSRSLNGNSEPAFYQKIGRKRKQHMCETEYKKMIDQCMGNIQSEIERDFEFNLGVPMMNYDHGAYGEVNFTWPASSCDSDSQDEKDDLEEFWKERDHSWATLALEKNQDSHSEGIHESTAGLGKREGDPCLHDCMQDEELGLVCRLCNVVCVEAKDIFPQMANGSEYKKERPARRNFDHGDLVLDPSLLAILGPEFSELRGSGNLWSLIPNLEPRLLPHQRKAFEFIWKNLAGSLQLEQMDKPSTSKGGCVVGHTPGSGKTLLLISFLVSYLKVHPRSRPLVLTQKSAIHTWRREFEKWGITVPLHVLHQADKRGKPLGAIDPRLQAILSNFHQLAWKNSCLVDRLDKLCKWHEHPSVLLMTYSSFRQLTKEDSVMPQQAFIAQVLINNPGLLILDEGHNPRSKKDMLRKALMKVKTECRILMSGTVLQNNFGEYFNTLSLARPRFVDDVMTALVPERKKETSGRGAEQREAVARRIFMDRVGQMIESSYKWDQADGISLLNKLTCGFIDSFEGSKLSSLPGLHVYTIFMKPTEVQEDILSKISMACTRNHFKVEPLITIASIHPWLIKTSECASTCFSPAEIDKVDRYKRNIAVGCKAKFVINLLHKSSYRGERVLIFCHNVSPISFLVELIENVFGWRLGEEVLVLQGEQELPVRSDVMDKFNTDSQGKRKVLIASTTACAEGISLTGASRLVMLDSEWNHSTTRQAIARAFRHGQERTVYVYLLVASGTWEEDKYSSNRRKAWMAKMVFHGCYFDYPLQKTVTAIDDSLLKELADEDKTKTFHMIVKQD